MRMAFQCQFCHHFCQNVCVLLGNRRWGVALGSGLKMEDSLWAGLTDSHAGLPMGGTAENLAEKVRVYSSRSAERDFKFQRALGIWRLLPLRMSCSMLFLHSEVEDSSTGSQQRALPLLPPSLILRCFAPETHVIRDNRSNTRMCFPWVPQVAC